MFDLKERYRVWWTNLLRWVEFSEKLFNFTIAKNLIFFFCLNELLFHSTWDKLKSLKMFIRKMANIMYSLLSKSFLNTNLLHAWVIESFHSSLKDNQELVKYFGLFVFYQTPMKISSSSLLVYPHFLLDYSNLLLLHCRFAWCDCKCSIGLLFSPFPMKIKLLMLIYPMACNVADYVNKTAVAVVHINHSMPLTIYLLDCKFFPHYVCHRRRSRCFVAVFLYILFGNWVMETSGEKKRWIKKVI